MDSIFRENDIFVNKVLTVTEFEMKNIPFYGNEFLIGNGYFGVRGTMEEYKKENMPCVNLAGIYDKVGEKWRESVNAPNPLFTYIKIDGEKLTLPEKSPFAHEQSINIETAVHTRKTVWETEKGKITVLCERFASMANQHLICMKYSVLADYDCEIEIVTAVDGDVWDINGPHFVTVKPEITSDSEKVTGITGEKGITVITEQFVKTEMDCNIETKCDAYSAYKVLTFIANKNTEYVFTKVSCISTSCDDFEKKPLEDYPILKQKHINAWKKIWDKSYIGIDGDEEAEIALNYSIYHLNCIAPRNMKNKSIAARGLSGQVYKGAVFWDTEMFMIDYFIHTEPKIAKTLIGYRIDTLKGAKNKAKEYNLKGAYYAWESQEGGYEGCSDYNVVDVFTKRPMRTHFRDKQYHVSSAVVYAIVKYIRATNDTSILSEGAMEVIIECARMYRSLLLKKADSSYYEIHDVVGPDEYHERVNNNTYTNKMAWLTFKTAFEMINKLDKGTYQTLDEKYDLKKLSAVFKDSYENIKINKPNDKTGLIEQFDGYFSLEDTTPDVVRSRLLDDKEYWGGAYGVASGTQVIKQADVIAMMSIFEEDYTKEEMHKNWEYYEPRTEHGSSLSACMYSLVACQIGNPDAAYPFFMKSAKTDLLPGGKEWAGLVYIGGTHPASEGGAWIVAVNGFAGVSIKNGKLVCNPNLPENWKGMHFKLMFKGEMYQIDIENNKGKVTKI